jgi:hypothetical protein
MASAMTVNARHRWLASSWPLLLVLALLVQHATTQDGTILPGDGEQHTLGRSAVLGGRPGGQLAWGNASSSSGPIARTAGRMVAMGERLSFSCAGHEGIRTGKSWDTGTLLQWHGTGILMALNRHGYIQWDASSLMQAFFDNR